MPSPEAYFERVHPLDREECRRLWNHAVADGTSFDHEHRIELPDRRVRHVRWIGCRFSNDAGEMEIISTVMDVTKEHHNRLQMRPRTAKEWVKYLCLKFDAAGRVELVARFDEVSADLAGDDEGDPGPRS